MKTRGAICLIFPGSVCLRTRGANYVSFSTQLSYTYFKDGVYHITEPYGTDGEATIIRTANLDHRHYFQAFVGGQFKLGVWQPRVNVGVMKQWLPSRLTASR